VSKVQNTRPLAYSVRPVKSLCNEYIVDRSGLERLVTVIALSNGSRDPSLKTENVLSKQTCLEKRLYSVETHALSAIQTLPNA